VNDLVQGNPCNTSGLLYEPGLYLYSTSCSGSMFCSSGLEIFTFACRWTGLTSSEGTRVPRV
jgi:hypothetical protein